MVVVMDVGAICTAPLRSTCTCTETRGSAWSRGAVQMMDFLVGVIDSAS